MPAARPGLSANALKLIAIFAMTLDHIAWLLYPGYSTEALPLAIHSFGRLTCPIMCYFIAEGYHYTISFRRYALRLFLLAVVSHFAYIFASNAYTGWRSFVPFSSGSLLVYPASEPDHVPGGLELHRRAVHFVDRGKPRRWEKTASLVRVLRVSLRRGLFCLSRPALRPYAAVRLFIRAAAAAL